MTQLVHSTSDQHPWSFNLNKYDPTPLLTKSEKSALSVMLRPSKHPIPIRKHGRATLSRLLQPLEDVAAYLHLNTEGCHILVRVMCIEMHRRGTAFWGWTIEDWCESMGSSNRAYAQRYGYKWDVGYGARTKLPVVVYLLCPHLEIDPLFRLVELAPLARKIFGESAVDTAVDQIITVLRSWGYQTTTDRKALTGAVSYLLLKNRSASLADLTTSFLESVAQTCTIACVQEFLFRISRALYALEVIAAPLPKRRGMPSPIASGTDGSVHQEWLAWCQRWRKQSPLQRKRENYYQLLKVGRWLKATHPEVTSPTQWTYELAVEFVAAVMEMKVGEWTAPSTRRLLQKERIGQPLRPGAKMSMLHAVSIFFRDCQEWEWILIRFSPSHAFRAPRPLRNLIGPNPRVVEKPLWAKILWSAMNLEEKDIPKSKGQLSYPLEMIRAIAMVWCFTALRSDEIRRLRVGCIRWQYEDVMIPETGEILPKDATCFLDIPVNKTSTAYTKPVHPLVGKCINEWEQIRPKDQFRELDKKTGEVVEFLFAYRGERVSKDYINATLIPLLCRKAGIPIEDSRGKITSHRARATIASMLYNAKEPLDVFQLQQYLGHKYLSSTQSYLLVDPTKLASKVAKAGYLEQNLATIEVLLDQEAVLSGAASRGETWKYYDLGHGWCTNPFWASCAHRMACAKCPFYRPKASLKDQLVEGKASLVRMLEFVQLTEDEKLLVTEGIELHQELIEKLVDVPTPAGPTPRELDTQRQGETKVIPLKHVQRAKSKQHGS